jgi:hypothetical protein
VLAACLLAGCRPGAEAAPEIALRWTVTPRPPSVGAATFSLELTDTMRGQAVSGATVRLEGNMSHPGMQPVFGTAREVEPGRYEARLDLTMAGDWMLFIDATLADGRMLRRQVSLPGVRGKTGG